MSNGQLSMGEYFARGLSIGAKRVLKKARRERYMLYVNYPLHERINMKANALSPRCVLWGSNRLSLHPVTINTKDLKEYYENIRINRGLPSVETVMWREKNEIGYYNI